MVADTRWLLSALSVCVQGFMTTNTGQLSSLGHRHKTRPHRQVLVVMRCWMPCPCSTMCRLAHQVNCLHISCMMSTFVDGYLVVTTQMRCLHVLIQGRGQQPRVALIMNNMRMLIRHSDWRQWRHPWWYVVCMWCGWQGKEHVGSSCNISAGHPTLMASVFPALQSQQDSKQAQHVTSTLPLFS